MKIDKSSLIGGSIHELAIRNKASETSKNQLAVKPDIDDKLTVNFAGNDSNGQVSWIPIKSGRKRVQGTGKINSNVFGFDYPIHPYPVLHAPSRLNSNVVQGDIYTVNSYEVLHAPSRLNSNVIQGDVYPVNSYRVLHAPSRLNANVQNRYE